MAVKLKSGRNGMAALHIDCGAGTAQIYLQGAHVTSWIPAGEDEVLFVSAAARFGANQSIRGGIPVAFPQFAELGGLPMHGFAHTTSWQWTAASDSGVELTLRESEATLRLWPHRFVAELSVDLAPRELRVGLTVHNPDEGPLAWAGTLHTFLSLAARQTAIRGLGPARFVDRARASVVSDDPGEELRIPGHTDRAYLDAGPALQVDDGRRRLSVLKRGFRDTVVWNPGPETSARFSDLLPADHAAFVCVEAAEVRPVALAPGARWVGSQTLRLD